MMFRMQMEGKDKKGEKYFIMHCEAVTVDELIQVGRMLGVIKD